MRTACRAGRALYAATTPQPQERPRFEFHWGRQTEGERRKTKKERSSRVSLSIRPFRGSQAQVSQGPSLAQGFSPFGQFSFFSGTLLSFLPSFLPPPSSGHRSERRKKKEVRSRGRTLRDFPGTPTLNQLHDIFSLHATTYSTRQPPSLALEWTLRRLLLLSFFRQSPPPPGYPSSNRACCSVFPTLYSEIFAIPSINSSSAISISSLLQTFSS